MGANANSLANAVPFGHRPGMVPRDPAVQDLEKQIPPGIEARLQHLPLLKPDLLQKVQLVFDQARNHLPTQAMTPHEQLKLKEAWEAVPELMGDINQALLYPNQPIDPTQWTEALNFVAEIVGACGIVLGGLGSYYEKQHLLPHTHLSALPYQMAHSPAHRPAPSLPSALNTLPDRARISAVLLAISSVIRIGGPEAVKRIKPRLGGSETRSFFTLSAAFAPVGVQAENLATFSKYAASLGFFGVVTSLLELTPALGQGTGPIIAAAISVVAVAALLTKAQSSNVARTRRLMDRPNSLQQLDIADNKTAPLLSSHARAAASPGDTVPRSTQAWQLAARSAGVVASASAAEVVQTLNPINAALHPSAAQAVKVFGAYFLGLCMEYVVHEAATWAYFDPSLNANREAADANDLLCTALRKSAADATSAALNRAGRFFHTVPPALAMEAVDQDDIGPDLSATDASPLQLDQQRLVFRDAHAIFTRAAADHLNKLSSQEKRTGADGTSLPVSLTLADAQAMRLRSPPATSLADTAATEPFKNLTQHFETCAIQCKTVAEQPAGPSSSAWLRMSELLSAMANDVTQAQNGALNGSPYGRYIRGLTLKTRELKAHLLMNSMEERKTAGGADAISALALEMLPIFAALRTVDRVKPAKEIINLLSGMITAQGKPADDAKVQQDAAEIARKLDQPASNCVFVDDLVDAITLKAPEVQAKIRRALDRIRTTPALKNAPIAAMKLTYFCNRLALNDRALAGEAAPTLDQAKHALQTAASFNVEDKIRDGSLDMVSIAELIRSRRDEINHAAHFSDVSDEEAGGRVRLATNLAAGIDRYIQSHGPKAVEALLEETDPSSAPDHQSEAFLKGMVKDLSKMEHTVRELCVTGLRLPSTDPSGLNVKIMAQRDSHQHPDNYNGVLGDLEQTIRANIAAGLASAAMMSIPHQSEAASQEVKYYLVARHGLKYRNKDGGLIAQYRKLPPDLRDRVIMSVTGIDPTDIQQIEANVQNKFKEFPEAAWLGEITIFKEVVTEQSDKAYDDGVAKTMSMLNVGGRLIAEAARQGRGITLHHDAGVPYKKKKYRAALTQAMQEAENILERSLKEEEEKFIAERPVIRCVLAHTGMSRFTPPPPDHTDWIRSLFGPDGDVSIKKNFAMDLSWDFTMIQMLKNLRDIMFENKLSPVLQRSIEELIVAYEATKKLGGHADKAADLLMPDLAAVLKVSNEKLADVFLLKMIDFRRTLQKELTEPQTKQGFVKMIKTTENKNGNNWLNLLHDCRDNLMFGTDTLGANINIHGKEQLTTTALLLHPFYYIFDELHAIGIAADDPDLQLGSVTRALARGTFSKFFKDKDLAARKAVMDKRLENEGGSGQTGRGRTYTNQPNVDNLSDDESSAAKQQPASVQVPETGSSLLTAREKGPADEQDADRHAMFADSSPSTSSNRAMMNHIS